MFQVNKFHLFLIAGLLALFALQACGGGGGSTGAANQDVITTEIDSCKQLQDVICSKVWGCFDRNQINKNDFGNSISDCKVKLEASECTETKVRCDIGTKFDAENAQECIELLQEFSCNDLWNKVPTPAICDQRCQ